MALGTGVRIGVFLVVSSLVAASFGGAVGVVTSFVAERLKAAEQLSKATGCPEGDVSLSWRSDLGPRFASLGGDFFFEAEGCGHRALFDCRSVDSADMEGTGGTTFRCERMPQ